MESLGEFIKRNQTKITIAEPVNILRMLEFTGFELYGNEWDAGIDINCAGNNIGWVSEINSINYTLGEIKEGDKIITFEIHPFYNSSLLNITDTLEEKPESWAFKQAVESFNEAVCNMYSLMPKSFNLVESIIKIPENLSILDQGGVGFEFASVFNAKLNDTKTSIEQLTQHH
jgi:hypothetical protein